MESLFNRDHAIDGHHFQYLRIVIDAHSVADRCGNIQQQLRAVKCVMSDEGSSQLRNVVHSVECGSVRHQNRTCINLINELQQYHWKKDAGGNSLKIPVDKNNHLIDGGLRYAYEDDMTETWFIS